jgi:S1-C subfamily serine protease
VITSVGGKKIADDNGLHLALTVFHPGEKVTVGWIDASGGSHSESVTLKRVRPRKPASDVGAEGPTRPRPRVYANLA